MNPDSEERRKTEVMPLEMEEYVRRAREAQSALYRTAVLILRDPSAAEEALDEAIYRGLLSCGSLREAAFFRTWLTRILMNACYAELRRRGRETTPEELPETAAEAYDALPLRQAVERLPARLREVVILRRFAGYTLAETAEILKIPQGTAATRERRALHLLRLELKEEEKTT